MIGYILLGERTSKEVEPRADYAQTIELTPDENVNNHCGAYGLVQWVKSRGLSLAFIYVVMAATLCSLYFPYSPMWFALVIFHSAVDSVRSVHRSFLFIFCHFCLVV